jgi:hypothetical protein
VPPAPLPADPIVEDTVMKRTLVLSLATLFALGACSESANRTLTAPADRPSFAVSGTSGAIIATDKDDYAPGEVVTITGQGWSAGETVHLTLTEDPVKDGPHDWDVVADSAGSFTDQSFAPGKQHLGVSFTLVATGPLSGVSTQLMFTDGAIFVNTSASGTSVVASKSEYSAGNCAAGNLISTESISLSTAALNIGGLGINSNQSKSVRLTFVSATGGTFTAWTSPDGVSNGTVTGLGTNVVCVTATSNGVGGTIVADVTPTPSAATTTTSVISSANPSSYGDEVTFTATVARSSGSGTPTGDVQFIIDGSDSDTPVTLQNGKATLKTTKLSVTTHTVAANYLGVTNSFNPSSGTLAGGQVVNKASHTISFAALDDMKFGDPDFTLTATASSGLTVSFGVSGDCDISGNTLSLTGAGSCTVTASQPGDLNFNAATSVPRTFSIAKATPSVSVTWSGGTYTGSPFGASASATGVGGATLSPVTLTYYAGAQVTETPLSSAPTNAGTYTVSGNFAGNKDYLSGSDVKTITIAQATPTISLTVAGPFVYDGSPHGATGGATGVGGTNDVLSPAVTLSYTGTGSTSYAPTATAPTDAGTYAVRASFAGNTNYESGSAGPVPFTIDKADQIIKFSSTPPTPAILGGTYLPSASGGASGNPVTLAASGGCTYSATTGSVTFTSVTTQCTVTANQAGNNNYNNAVPKSQQFGIIFQWAGFFQPIDNNGVFNSVKAGSAVPVKFSLGGNQGLGILAVGSPASATIACSATATVDAIEETSAAGGSSLSYDPTVAPSGQYVYVWKTDKTWAGTCRQLVVTLVDGTKHPANFQFQK